MHHCTSTPPAPRPGTRRAVVQWCFCEPRGRAPVTTCNPFSSRAYNDLPHPSRAPATYMFALTLSPSLALSLSHPSLSNKSYFFLKVQVRSLSRDLWCVLPLSPPAQNLRGKLFFPNFLWGFLGSRCTPKITTWTFECRFWNSLPSAPTKELQL